MGKGINRAKRFFNDSVGAVGGYFTYEFAPGSVSTAIGRATRWRSATRLEFRHDTDPVVQTKLLAAGADFGSIEMAPSSLVYASPFVRCEGGYLVYMNQQGDGTWEVTSCAVQGGTTGLAPNSSYVAEFVYGPNTVITPPIILLATDETGTVVSSAVQRPGKFTAADISNPTELHGLIHWRDTYYMTRLDNRFCTAYFYSAYDGRDLSGETRKVRRRWDVMGRQWESTPQDGTLMAWNDQFVRWWD